MPALHAQPVISDSAGSAGSECVATHRRPHLRCPPCLLWPGLALQGQPRQVLTIPQQSASAGLSGSTAVGLTDLAFFGGGAGSGGGGGGSSGSGGGYVVLASGMGGQVFLWDCRAKAAPSATLSAAAGGQGQGAAYAVQLSPDQQVVMAGMQSGEVKLWDLR